MWNITQLCLVNEEVKAGVINALQGVEDLSMFPYHFDNF